MNKVLLSLAAVLMLSAPAFANDGPSVPVEVGKLQDLRKDLELSRVNLFKCEARLIHGLTELSEDQVDLLLEKVDPTPFVGLFGDDFVNIEDDLDRAIESLGGERLTDEEINKIMLKEVGLDGNN